MLLIGRLMPEQITVRTGFAKRLVALPAPLPERKRHRAVRMPFLDSLYDPDHYFIRKMRILPALKNNRMQAEAVAFVGAGQNLLFREAVTVTFAVASSDSAVETVVFTEVADLDQSPYKDFIPVYGFPQTDGFGSEVFRRFRGPVCEKEFIFLRSERMLAHQAFREFSFLLLHNNFLPVQKSRLPIPDKRLHQTFSTLFPNELSVFRKVPQVRYRDRLHRDP